MAVILTASDFAEQMVAQLRILDPSISAQVGTPERKIIDAVAQGLADNQVDLTGLTSALNIDTKYGTNLDRFTALFGFGRQTAQAARGYVIFSRIDPAPADIIVPISTTIQSNTSTTQNQFMQYATVTPGTIPAGQKESDPVLVQCLTAGTMGNSAAKTLTNLVGTPVPIGVTAVTNPAPIVGGNNIETDDAFKVRFKNTVFRNLAGTEDQYLALAVSGAFTTKANVIGSVSKYQEYIQIPDWDDAGYLNGALSSDSRAATGGVQGQWTTALSSIPYAQDIYVNPVPFVSNGEIGVNQFFYRNDVDFDLNYPPFPYGDAIRENRTTGIAPNFTFYNVFNAPTVSPLPGLQATAPGDILLAEFNYLSSSSRNSIKHDIMNAVDVYVDGEEPTQTSCVFLPGATQFTLSPTDAYYIENYRRDGQPNVRPLPGNYFTSLFQTPLVSLPDTITVNNTNYYRNVHYWLVHETGLLGGSVRARDGIEWSNYIGADTGGIVPPVDASNNYDPLQPYEPSLGSDPSVTFNSLPPNTNVEVDNYYYDANVPTLQASLESSKQVTTDALAHRSQRRYFKLDVTVMYGAGVNYALVNTAIGASINAFFQNQFFGSVIQLSDLLDVIHQSPGVDNVRWSNDLINAPNTMRVIETDINGVPLHTPYVSRVLTNEVFEIQRLFLPGVQHNVHAFNDLDSFRLHWEDTTLGVDFKSLPIFFNALATSAHPETQVTSAITDPSTGFPSTSFYGTLGITPDYFIPNARSPLTSLSLQFLGGGANWIQEDSPLRPWLPHVTDVNVADSPFAFDSDFFLYDNELPALPTGQVDGDTLPGLIIRPRAQNTFTRPGLG